MKIIEKKITDTFLQWNELQTLAALVGLPENFEPLFYDIETTGLSKKTTQLYLIGAVYHQKDDWYLKQWFSESTEEESCVLASFLHFCTSFSHTIQYNGTRFDIPYLRERCSVHGLISSIDTLPALDLYQILRPIKLFLQLNHMSQTDIEQFLQLPPRKYPDGKTCIKHYTAYISSHKEEDLLYCLGHNEEDLLGMGQILLMLNYQGLFESAWTFLEANFDENEILFHLKLTYPVPIPVSGGIPGIYLSAEQDMLRLLVQVTNGQLQQFYLNYKDYDYLIEEDSVIPKSLGTYIDKSLKKAATLETCYTWFSYNEAFTSDSKKQLQYLKHVIPYILQRLCK